MLVKSTAAKSKALGTVTAGTGYIIDTLENITPSGHSYTNAVKINAGGSSTIDNGTFNVLGTTLYYTPTTSQASFTVVYAVLYV